MAPLDAACEAGVSVVENLVSVLLGGVFSCVAGRLVSREFSCDVMPYNLPIVSHRMPK